MSAPMPLATLGETLVTALVGLIGVVVGAAMNWAAQRAQARRREEGEKISAARLVNSELTASLAVIENALEANARLSGAVAVQLETPVWLEFRAPLALTLAHDAWGKVRDAHASIAVLRVGIVDGAKAQRDLEDDARTALDAIRTAQAALEPV